MHNLNSLIIEGNVVRDPVVKATPKGTPLCMFSIASNRFFKQEDQTTQETSFFDVETWARLKLHKRPRRTSCRTFKARPLGRHRW